VPRIRKHDRKAHCWNESCREGTFRVSVVRSLHRATEAAPTGEWRQWWQIAASSVLSVSEPWPRRNVYETTKLFAQTTPEGGLSSTLRWDLQRFLMIRQQSWSTARGGSSTPSRIALSEARPKRPALRPAPDISGQLRRPAAQKSGLRYLHDFRDTFDDL